MSNASSKSHFLNSYSSGNPYRCEIQLISIIGLSTFVFFCYYSEILKEHFVTLTTCRTREAFSLINKHLKKRAAAHKCKGYFHFVCRFK